MATGGTSTAASGPGGTNFEAKVGAYYLLTLLLGTAARGLRGATLERVGLQRVNEGFPLDDVVLHGRRADGSSAVLQIQVKRTLSFAPSDTVFEDVVRQVAPAVAANDADPSMLFAVATARSSRKIDGPYQEVLQWARDLDDAESFFARLKRAGAASDDMRNFVATFRSHVASNGGDHSDDAMWLLLRRFIIMVFDFTALYGQSEALTLEHCFQALSPDDQNRAGALWAALQTVASDIAVSGGRIDVVSLRSLLFQEGFKLTGSRKNAGARVALAEMSDHALRDIGDRVGKARLSHHGRIAAVHAARDASRYVEIRGDGGVGKSGVLKALASQLIQQSNVIVLSPNRAPEKGWIGLRAMLGYDGSARELLSEIAASGGATLFVDGLDYFSERERAVVRDLVDEASKIPGFDVIVTARRDFGKDEVSWLPTEALDRLGKVQTVTIDELSNEDVLEIEAAEPHLAPLLAESHPARSVVRNLFRLGRLLNRSTGEPVPTTETEMALTWWKTADGTANGDLRDRSRILRDLVGQSLAGEAAVLQTVHHPARALDALVRSETLRDLGAERMTFRHDVLRDWAVANGLVEDIGKIGQMPLDRPIPTTLARGVELAARIVLEQSSDGLVWKELLDRVSDPSIHGSWRRTVLLAVTRSELGATAIHHANAYLVADDARLLRELIRTAKAVDVMPASVYLPQGVSAPSGLMFPSGPSWTRLITWSLQLGDRFPPAAIPDSVDFFGLWLAVTNAVSKIAPKVVAMLYNWLMAIERDDEYPLRPGRGRPFNGAIGYYELRSLKRELRMYFLQFCHKTPALAGEYLQCVEKQGSHGRETADAIFKSSGQLAKAAPDALAELAWRALIPPPPKRRDGFFPPERREAFTHLDRDLHNVSPAQGPFLDLLEHAPDAGLTLVRRLVAHLTAFYRGDGQDDSEPIAVLFPTGNVRFIYPWTYTWSRDANGNYSVTCALMALEAWAHRRIEAGESIESLAASLIGEGDCPAAFLLVVVDVLISHWPETRRFAVPFLGIPELLALDQRRQNIDSIRSNSAFDFSMFGEKEPQGLATLQSLKRRASRAAPLGNLLMYYAHYEPLSEREQIAQTLRVAAERLGTPDAHADLADPAFLTLHSINMLDPANYRPVKIPQQDGSEVDGLAYVPPASERNHLMPGLARAQANIQESVLRSQLAQALEDPGKATVALVEQGLAWARKIQGDGVELPDFDRSVEIVAALLLRDGVPEQRATHGDWARKECTKAIGGSEDPVHRSRTGLQFNPIGIGTLGMVHAALHTKAKRDVRNVLELAVRGDPAAAHGFAASLDALVQIDPKLPSAVLRCAISGVIRPRIRHYNPQPDDEGLKADAAVRAKNAVDAELAWLRDKSEEPSWPPFPEAIAQPREKIYITPPDSEEDEPKLERPVETSYVDHQAAAVWLSLFTPGGGTRADWMQPVVETYSAWTAGANGATLDRREQVSDPPRHWNPIYWRLVARCVTQWDDGALDRFCLHLLASLPDEAFLDAMSDFLRSLDFLHLTGKGPVAECMVAIRANLAEHFRTTDQYKRLTLRHDHFIEHHTGEALQALFFTNAGFRQRPECYVPKADGVKMLPFIPVLESLAIEGASLGVAIVTVALLDAAAYSEFASFGVAVAKAWVARFPDDTVFWVDNGIGIRWCDWLKRVYVVAPNTFAPEALLRRDTDRILSDLVRVGVAEASQLETTLRD